MHYLKNKINGYRDQREARKFNSFFNTNKDRIMESVKSELGPARVPTPHEVLMLRNASIATTGGMGTSCDKAVGANPIIDQPLPLPIQLLVSEELYFSDWQAQKIVEIPVDDMLRKPWVYEGLEEENVKKIETYHKKLNLDKVIREALRLERLHGGAAIFIGIRDEIDDPSLPISQLDLKDNAVVFLNAMSRQRVSRMELQFDPTSPNYGRPLFYFINGHKVHRSRLLIFDGDPLLPVPSGIAPITGFTQTSGFGAPILMRIYNSLLQSTGARQAAFDLIQKASVMVFSGDIQSQSTDVQGVKAQQVLENALRDMSTYKACLFQKNAGEGGVGVSNIAASFGSVPELVGTYLEVLASASDIPVTRFLGETAKGLNSTGEGDLENYYNKVGSQQRHRLEPQLNKLLRLTMPSAGVDVPPDEVSIKFPALWNANALEEAQVRQIDTANVQTMVESALISDEEGVEELKQRSVLMTNPTDFPPPDRDVLRNNMNDGDVSSNLDELRDV